MLHDAPTQSPALIVLNYDVHDQPALETYRLRAGDIIAPDPANLVTSSDRTQSLGEGPVTGSHTVILQYRSVADARAHYESEAYRAHLPDRLAATTPRAAFIVDVTRPESLLGFGN